MQCKFISSNSRDMPQAVNPRPVSAEARLLSRDNSCEIYSGQNGTGTGFSARSASPYQYQCFYLSVSFHQCSIYILIYKSLLTEGQTGKAWKPTKGQSSLARVLSIFFNVQRVRTVSGYRGCCVMSIALKGFCSYSADIHICALLYCALLR